MTDGAVRRACGICGKESAATLSALALPALCPGVLRELECPQMSIAKCHFALIRFALVNTILYSSSSSRIKAFALTLRG